MKYSVVFFHCVDGNRKMGCYSWISLSDIEQCSHINLYNFHQLISIDNPGTLHVVLDQADESFRF